MSTSTVRLALALSMLASSLLAGCGGTAGTDISTPPPPVSPPANSYSGPAFSGKAAVGAQPLIGASIQVYAAGTTGNGSASTRLLTAALTTDSAGAFQVPAGYPCPTSTSQVYAVATGGSPTSASNAANPAIALTTALGICNQIPTTVTLNEITTSAAAWSLAAFFTSSTALGASSTNATGLANAFLIAATLANPTTGASPGATLPANVTTPAPRINALANLLNTCTRSLGTVLASSSCLTLFTAATPSGLSAPTNTLDAALSIVHHPASNASSLYTLALTATAFSPMPSAAPADWTLFSSISGGGLASPSTLGITSAGNVWVADYTNVASQFTPTGAPQFPSGITGFSLNSSYGLAVDASDNAWIANDTYMGSVTKLLANGSSGVSYTGQGLEFPAAVAIDPDTSVWVADYGSGAITHLSASGSALSGATGFFNAQIAFPAAIAVDSSHNLWAANQSGTTITRLSQDGSTAASANCCNAPSGLAIDSRGFVWATNFYTNSVSQVSSSLAVVSSGYTGGGIYRPQGIAIDGAGNVWVANFHAANISEIAGSQSATPGAALSPSAGLAPDAPVLQAYSIAIDASGNVWLANFGNNTVTRYIGLASPTRSPAIGPAQAP